MRCLQNASVNTRSRSFYLLGMTALGLTLAAVACGNADDSGAPSGAAGNGGTTAHGGTTGRGGSSGAAGSGDRSSGGAPGGEDFAGAKGTEAGAGGDVAQGGEGGSAGADAAEAGAAEGHPEVIACEAGGTLFVVGNYVNAAGDELLLRSTASAATIALVPKAPAVPAKPPQLFAVERVCSAGGALLVRDASSSYRVDFSQSGSQLALCLSSPVATLGAASSLPPANWAHESDTGCAGHPFSVYTTEML